MLLHRKCRSQTQTISRSAVRQIQLAMNFSLPEVVLWRMLISDNLTSMLVIDLLLVDLKEIIP